jgi:His/Glu/Gln/Arg/opine family amino acid ABC transporter permease subunit
VLAASQQPDPDRIWKNVDYHLDFGPIWTNRGLIAEGLLNTIALSATALVIALALGTIIGTAGATQKRALRTTASLYVELMRNVPLLIHMYVWYMALAFLKLPAFTCAMFGLSLYSGAYVAEVVRAGIGSVPAGQMQAALAGGLTRLQSLRLVIYPQALRAIAPSLASLLSQLIKDSSLASVIAVAELTYEAGAIEGQTFRTFEVYITISVIYLVLVTALSRAVMLVPGASAPTIGRLADA